MNTQSSHFSASRIARSVLAGIALLLPLTTSSALTQVNWTLASTGSQNWSVSANWKGSAYPNSTGVSANIGEVADIPNLLNNSSYAINQDIGAGVTLGALTFDLRSVYTQPTDVGSTSIGSSTLTLSSVVGLSVGTELWSGGGYVANGTRITAINGNVVTLSSNTTKASAGGNLFQTGVGNTTVALSGNSITLGGATPTLTVSGVLSTSSVTIGNNLVFAGTGPTAMNTTNAQILTAPTLTGVLSGSGNVSMTASYVLNNTSGTASSQSGAWTVQRMLTFGNSDSAGSASYMLNASNYGGQVRFANASNGTYTNLFAASGTVTSRANDPNAFEIGFSGVGGVTNTLTNLGDYLAGTGSFNFLTSGGTGNSVYKVTTANWSPTAALALTGSNLELASASGTQALSGNITGTGALVRSTSGGTSVLSGNNTYSGGTTVTGGTLVTTKAAALSGYNSAGKVVINGGTLGVQVGGSGWTDANVNTLLSNAIKTSGALGIDTTNGDFAQVTAYTPTNLGGLGLTKLGANTLTLNAANTYTGTTTVTAGTLVLAGGGSIGNGTVAVNGGQFTVNGAVGNGGVTVANGATLGGNGTIAGAVSIASGGTLAPGNSPGIIGTGNLSLAAGSSLSAEITGSGTVAGTNYDQVNVTGTVTLGGNLTLTITSYTPTNGHLFFLINNDSTDAIASGFANVNGGSLSNNTEFNLAGNRWFISYAANYNGGVGSTFTGGNDVALYAIPEPSIWGLVAFSLTTVMVLRRRRRE